MKNIFKLSNDIIGIFKICGPIVCFKYIIYLFIKFKSVFINRNLMVVDDAMGSGPYNISFRIGRKFKVYGKSVLSGIREMYVRDIYTRGGILKISDGDLVVDLGANIGNFTNMALAQGPRVRVVAVEPSSHLNKIFFESLSLNQGHPERVTLIRSFLGSPNDFTNNAVKEDPSYSGVPWIMEEDLIEKTDLTKIDFLKCDIEGGEFELFIRNSRLLSITKSLAIEVHAFAGNVDLFITNIEESGFRILEKQWASDGSCTLLAKKY